MKERILKNIESIEEFYNNFDNYEEFITSLVIWLRIGNDTIETLKDKTIRNIHIESLEVK